MTKRTSTVTGGRPLQLPRHLPPLAASSTSDNDSSNGQDLVDLQNPSKAALSIKHLRRLCTLLEQEVALLEKIRYKQKNQHKAATWWRHVAGSQRVAKRFAVAFSTELGSTLSLLVVDTTATPASEARPALSGQAIIRSMESCLRLLHLAEHSMPIHAKAMAALEQLLRAALFMPLALALKGLIARLDGLSRLFDAELRNFLLIQDATTKRRPDLAKSLQQHVRRLPKSFQGYLRPSPEMSASSAKLSALRSLPGSAAASASPASSALPSAVGSRLASPVPSQTLPAGLEDVGVPISESAEASINSRKQADVPDASPINLEPTRRRREKSNEQPGANVDDTSRPPRQDPIPAPAVPPPGVVKKRKKPAAPRDDIDDIFGGL